ncbi:MAG: Ig-like domain-containing protein [Gemmatimonadota bacterium]|nr:Ig-like domain-containing protein [Gemmatimonadota bacterium]
MSDRRIISASLGTMVAAFAAWVAACADGAVEPPHVDRLHPVAVTVTPASTVLSEIGATAQIVVGVHDQNGQVMTGVAVAWSSSDVAVASVDASGLVTAVGIGKTTLTATAGPVSGAATVRVAQSTSESDREALIALYNATGGPNWVRSDNWLSDRPLDDWYGIDTDDLGRVVDVSLSGAWDWEDGGYVPHGLAGQIPPELGNLTHLETLDLGTNSLIGAIPPELGNLINLGTLDLGSNSLTGQIPPELVKLVSLATLNLARNQLAGAIPPELVNLANLELLDLYYNLLTGEIPPELGNLSNLRELDLGFNQLSGPIPPELGNLVKLRSLGLAVNHLDGAIPAELGNLADLASLDLESNQLTGAIPAEIGTLSNLRTLFLQDNWLMGPLPQSLLGTHLNYLFVGDNPDLCVPGTVAFATWLGDIKYRHDADKVDHCNATDLLALRTFHAATGGSNWTRSDGWTSERPVEVWHGVEADSLGMVVGLDIADNNVAGDFPSSLANLAALTELHLTGNSVAGRLPLGFVDLPLHTVLVEPTVCAPSEAAFQNWWAKVPTKLHLQACAPLSDRDLLVAAYHAMGGDHWRRNDNWLSNEPLSTWYGVETTSGSAGQSAVSGRRRIVETGRDRGVIPGDVLLDNASLEEELAKLRSRWKGADAREEADLASANSWAPVHAATDGSVTSLDLAYNGLVGRIPAEIGFLSSLEWLNLKFNELEGAIPPSLGSLENLTHLYLGGDLHGSLPPEIGGLSKLKALNLQASGLSGPLPPEIGSLANLQVLNLSFNDLTGPIPRELGNLVQLDSLNLDLAFLRGQAGSIPPELSRLANVDELSLVGNGLTGTIPAELGDLPKLRTLRLWLNELTGPIPPTLGRLSRLERLVLSRNQLSGSMPPALANLRKLEYFSVTGNQLSGPIPPEFGRLRNLKILALGGNDLSGSIPSELGSSSSSLEEIYLWGNSFDGGFGSWFGNLPSLKVLYAPDSGLSGPVPPSFGQLSALKWLYLSENPGMSGELPSTLTALDELDRFLVGGTGLCAPGDPAFQAWLEGVTMQHGISRCHRSPVVGAYLVQAVQSAQHPVPLVAGRDALLRVFVTADAEVDANVPAVRAIFYRDGALVYAVDVAALNVSIPTEPTESSLAASSNADIPGIVIHPGLEMVVEIDPGGTLDPALGIARRIPEAGRLALDIREVPPFEVTVVPFVPTVGKDRAGLERIQNLDADDPLFHDTRTLLPVDDMTVAVRDLVVTSTNDMFVLLRELDALRITDGGSGYYMGTLAGEWSENSPRGVAPAVPSRAQMSRLDASTIAHEFGHNLHLYHAPCGGAGNRDSGYPYAQGTIGAWGYDFATDSLVSPRQADFMTYCDPAWVSPYHFSNALRWRRKSNADTQAAARVATERMLLLWGGADADGALALEPAFLFDGQASLPDSAGAWRVAGEAADGTELFALDFHMAEVADGDGRRSFVFAIPANPAWAGRLARIVLASAERQTSIENDAGAPLTVLRDAATGRIRGFLRDPRDAEALTRGESPVPTLTELGVDPERIEVTVSRGVPRASDWRR